MAREHKLKDLIENIRIKEEGDLFSSMMRTFSADVISPLVCKKDKLDDDTLSGFIRGHYLKLSEDFGCDIFRLCQEVLKDVNAQSILGIPIEFYVESNNEANASALQNFDKKGPHYIVFNSGLLNMLDKEELRFIVGHELGHLIYEHAFLNWLLATFYRNNEMPLCLKGIYDFWNELSEMSADRIGLLVVKDLDTAIQAAFKVSSGLNMKKMNTTSKNYICMMDNLISDIKQDQGSRMLYFHPANPVRVKALELFYHSRTRQRFIDNKGCIEDDELTLNTGVLIDNLRLKPTTELQQAEFDFLMSAGYLIMTGESGWNDEKGYCLVNILAGYHYRPKILLDNCLNEKTMSDMFERSSLVIAERYTFRANDLFAQLVPLIARGDKISKHEMDMLFCIAKKLKIPEDAAVGMILEIIKDHFKPRGIVQ